MKFNKWNSGFIICGLSYAIYLKISTSGALQQVDCHALMTATAEAVADNELTAEHAQQLVVDCNKHIDITKNPWYIAAHLNKRLNELTAAGKTKQK